MAEQTQEMRAAYVDTIMALAEKNKNIVVLEADLMSCTNTGCFQESLSGPVF